jgi:hypothetical protein
VNKKYFEKLVQGSGGESDLEPEKFCQLWMNQTRRQDSRQNGKENQDGRGGRQREQGADEGRGQVGCL